MPFPDIDLKISGLPIAFVITPARKLEIRKIKLIQSKFFVMRPYGVFEIEPSKGIPYQKQMCYFYDARNAKPIDIHVMKDLEYFSRTNNLQTISRSDVKHASSLRTLMASLPIKDALEKLKSLAGDNQAKINEAVSDTVANLTRLEQENKPVAEVQGGYFLLQSLSKAGLVSDHEKNELDHKLTNGLLNFGELVEELQNLEVVTIQSPITLSVERFLQDFHTYSPSDVDGFIDRAERLGKKISALSSPTVKNWIPASLVFAILVGGAIAVMVLTQIDTSNLPISLPGMNVSETLPEVTDPTPAPEEEPSPVIEGEDVVEDVSEESADEPLVWDPEAEKWVPPQDIEN